MGGGGGGGDKKKKKKKEEAQNVSVTVSTEYTTKSKNKQRL